MDHIDELSHAELLALGGLLRLLVRLDGRFSDAEREALRQVASMVGEAGAAPIGEERLFAILDEAASTLTDDEALRSAALGVTRPEARGAIHAAVTFVANVDVAPDRELSLLDWLAREWNLPH